MITDDGVMKLVQIRHRIEIADPSNDIAALIGTIVKQEESGVWDSPRLKPQLPELWYWNNKFWLQGVDKLGIPYYRNKCHVLYEVQINGHDELLSNLKSY